MPDIPTNNTELYLANIAGESEQLPDFPTNKIERFLEKIAENGGGGESNAVKYTAQTLTAAQQAQARENICAIAAPSTASSGQFLVYDGSTWVAQTVPSASGVSF